MGEWSLSLFHKSQGFEYDWTSWTDSSLKGWDGLSQDQMTYRSNLISMKAVPISPTLDAQLRLSTSNAACPITKRYWHSIIFSRGFATSSLAPIMAFRLLGAQPIHKPTLAYSLFDPLWKTKLYSKKNEYRYFRFWKSFRIITCDISTSGLFY